MIVVADTGPIHYLILSGHIGLVHDLYGAVLLLPAVHRELLHPRTPPSVWEWAQNLPRCADIRTPTNASRFEELGPGEREAIALALEAHADFVLMDESLGRRTAVRAGVAVKGTLGVLEDGAARKLADLPEAIRRLRATNIFLTDEVVDGVLKRHESRRQDRERIG